MNQSMAPGCSHVSLVHQPFIHFAYHSPLGFPFIYPPVMKHGNGDPLSMEESMNGGFSSQPCLTTGGYINLHVFSFVNVDADLKQLVYESFIGYMLLHEYGSDLLYPSVHICIACDNGCECSSPMLIQVLTYFHTSQLISQ